MDNHIQEEVVESQDAEITPDESVQGESQVEPESGEAESEEFDFSPFLDKLELKVNKEPMKVKSVEELIALAQKGADYDRVKSKLEESRNDPLKSWASEYMKENGYNDPAEFVSAAQKAKEEKAIRDLIDSKGLPEDVARELHESKKFREEYQSKEKARREKEAQDKMYKDFAERYPEVKADDVPSEIWEQVENGKNLLLAYAEYENAKLKEALRQAQKAQTAKEAAPGSVKGKGKTQTKHFTKEQVAAMSTDDVKANYAAIMESRKKW